MVPMPDLKGKNSSSVTWSLLENIAVGLDKRCCCCSKAKMNVKKVEGGRGSSIGTQLAEWQCYKMVMQLEECAGTNWWTDGVGGWMRKDGGGTDSVLIRLQVPPSFAWQRASESSSPSPLMRTTRHDFDRIWFLSKWAIWPPNRLASGDLVWALHFILRSVWCRDGEWSGSHYSVCFVMFHLCIKGQ